MSETNRKINGENTSTTRAFHELESKGMLKKIDVMKYRGREFSKYWLSERGMAFALLNSNVGKVSPNTIRGHALDYDKTLEIYFKLRELSPKIANILDRGLLLEGRINQEELIKQILGEVIVLGHDEIGRLLNLIRESKEFGDDYKTVMKTVSEFLKNQRKLLGE